MFGTPNSEERICSENGAANVLRLPYSIPKIDAEITIFLCRIYIITDSGIMNHDITAHMISTIVTGQVISSGMLLLGLYKHKQMIARYAAMNDTTCTTAGIQQLVQYVVTTRLMQDTLTPSPLCQGVRPLPLCP